MQDSATQSYEIFIPISNGFQWELRPFVYFFDKHWNPEQPVTVLTAGDPGLSRLRFVPVRRGIYEGDWHFGRYSDGLMGFMEHDCDKPLVVLLNADYWLSKPVDTGTFRSLIGYMLEHPEVARIAISTNGGTTMHAEPLEEWEGLTIMGCPEGNRACFFPMSLLPAIWNRERWLDVLAPQWNPWETETRGYDAYIADKSIVSLTVNKPPLEYWHAARTRSRAVYRRGIPQEDWEAVSPMVPGGFQILA